MEEAALGEGPELCILEPEPFDDNLVYHDQAAGATRADPVYDDSYPDGAESMADIQTWPEHHFQRCHDFGVIIPHWIKERQIYTTCLWAGMGTHAVALLYIKHFVKWAYDINMKLTCHSMTDYDKTCQRLLKTFRPRCLFGDLSEQFPEDLENNIRAQQTRLRNEFEDFQGTCLQKKQEKDELTLGFRLLVEELAEQTQWQWPTRAICSIRSDGLLPQEADLHPPLDKDDIWLEAISPSCVNWSKQGKRMGWLGEQSLPMILYAIGMRQRSRLPHLVMLECVPDFDLGCNHLVRKMGPCACTTDRIAKYSLGFGGCGFT